MNKYIFLTDEGYTYQPSTESIESEDAAKAFDAIIVIVKSDINLAREIICEEKFCNYYEDIESYYELSAALVNDDILWEVDEQDEFYDFLLECQDEEELKNALTSGGWFVSNGFAICLDDEIAKMINVSYRE